MIFNSPHENDDCALFGRILLSWGDLEIKVVNLLIRLIHPAFCMGIERLPLFLRPRIALAKRGYEEIPAMRQFNEDALKLFAKLEKLSEKRHVIVHGYYQGFTGSDKYMFGRYVQSKEQGKTGFKFEYFTREEITELMNDIDSLSNEFDKLSKSTFLVPLPKLIRSKTR